MKVLKSVLLCTVSCVSLLLPCIGSASAVITCKGNGTLVEKQQAILDLLQHPYQRNIQPQLLAMAASWQFELKLDQYTSITALNEFLMHHKHGLIGPDEVFTIYNPVHRDQTIALFQLLYSAKNWESLCNSLVWARFNVNAGQFIYTLSALVAHDQDLKGVVLPAIYEIDPHFFFPAEVINCAAMLMGKGLQNEQIVDGAYTVVIQSNATSDRVHLNQEQLMAYFTEDVGLSAYHYNLHIDWPFWFGGRKERLRSLRRGEVFLFEHQQLVARYNLERISNNLGRIAEFSWRAPIQTGYFSYMRTRQGQAFARRDNHHLMYQPNNYFDVDRLNTYESRLLDAIDSGYLLSTNGSHNTIKMHDGIDKLGNIIHGNPDSYNSRYYRYLETVYRVLGRSIGSDRLMRETIYPNILEHPETQLRDPAYWQWMNRMNSMYWNYKDNMVPYGMSEIIFPPVRILSVGVDELTTYLEPYEADITNAVDIKRPGNLGGRIAQFNGKDFVIKAHQWRLNYTPFKINLRVSSLSDAPSVVRIFLGPKFDSKDRPISFNENRRNFFLLDAFAYELKKGNNVILRNSGEFSYGRTQDRKSFFEMLKMGMEYDPSKIGTGTNGFPNRLLLPKGTEFGQVYQLFVHVAPFHPTTQTHGEYGASGSRIDSMALGYPLDRPINERIWNTPNMRYHDVTIFHRNYNDSTIIKNVLVHVNSIVPNVLDFQ